MTKELVKNLKEEAKKLYPNDDKAQTIFMESIDFFLHYIWHTNEEEPKAHSLLIAMDKAIIPRMRYYEGKGFYNSLEQVKLTDYGDWADVNDITLIDYKNP